MELFLNTTSPYARMARIVMMEKGLASNVTLRWCDPWANDAELLEANPAGRIPALITEDGTTLGESLLIAYFLEGIGQGESLLPATRLSQVLHLAGLGQGLMDAAFSTVITRKHMGAEVDESVLGQRRKHAIQRILERLASELDEDKASGNVTLGDISVAVALDYVAFRLPEVNWPQGRPQLDAWHRRIAGRESFRQTAFE